VVVRDGVVVGEGAHFYDELDHAEVVALKHAGERAHGASAYVTLEPCSHQGRTGPCTAALIAAGVRRVVVATVDPNPQVAGEGIRRLRAAGIEVEAGVLEQEARELNEAFAKFIRTRRPLVTLKAGLSADGMLAPQLDTRAKRQTHWLTGAEARTEVQRMRHGADAVLTGIGTVLADDPALTDRSGIVGLAGRARRRPLLRMVLDSHLRLSLDSQLVRSACGDVLVLSSVEAEAGRAAALETAGVQVERVAGRGGRLDLGVTLDLLGEREILSLLLECGSELNGAFLAQGLVDKVVLFYSQTVLGEGAVPFAAGAGSPLLLERELKGRTRTMFGADTRVSGYLRNPWDGVELR
jgi:diaminohydroxyphosphoribosylaminopyrimidine deaminase/5-amino-6-(5-phosphoribosylamino)uracil reductase